MPAPVVYALAIVSTVGAIIVFKEFVFDPHIAPAIDRWRAEYQAAKRRREAEPSDAAHVEVQMSQTQRRDSTSRRSGRASNGSSSDDDESSSMGAGKPVDSKLMKGGLLFKHPEVNSQKEGGVELDNLVAREVRCDSSSQVLRQRKNLSEDAMDEPIRALPYTPLSPSHTHVIYDPSTPSTPSATGRGPTPLYSPIDSPAGSKLHPLESKKPIGATNTGMPYEPCALPAPITRDELRSTYTLSPTSVLTPVPATTLSQPPLVSASISTTPPAQGGSFSSNLAPNSNSPTSLQSLPPFFHPRVIPSLSQSYPQELDYEHGLELLSPPSSRSESPFSMAEVSPNQGLRPLSPFSNVSSTRSASGFSSSVSSPSPLRMGLGNQSFDAISPQQQPQGISSFLSPLAPTRSLSATSSARSTTYLSFEDDSSDTAGDQTQSYANLGTSSARVPVEGAFGREATTSPSPKPPSSTSQLGSRTSASEQIHGLGLTLFSQPSTINSVGSRDSSHFRLSGDSFAAGTPDLGFPTQNHPPPIQSDGELSDLDFMSDFAPSESDFGNESDSSWILGGGSQAGGSPAASPRMGAGANVTQGGNARNARNGLFGFR